MWYRDANLRNAAAQMSRLLSRKLGTLLRSAKYWNALPNNKLFDIN
jgi:hypothetical protein